MTIVMGLDQHRAQITADWLDTATGEVSRARIAPADRAGVRRFAGRFRGQELEVALEATTGWRFVVEELQAAGARVHLAEPAETAARRGTKKRAKSDRADARHLRELLMVGRLPESWIPPAHLLDLRARVRLRHTLVDARREWQQRMQAVLYHHGVPSRSWLMTAASREWLAQLELPATAREQITIALSMIDAHDTQLAPLDQRAARVRAPPAGCRALMRHYGIGPLTSITILAELGDPRRFSSSREAVRYAGLDITVHQSDSRRAPGHLSRQGPPALRWALFEAAQCARRTSSPDHDYYQQAAERLGGNRACLAVARKLLKRSYHTLRELGEEALAARMTTGPRALPALTPMHRGRLPACSCRHPRVDGLHRPSGRTASRNTPSPIMSPTRSHPGSRTEIRLGVRAHPTRTTNHAHAPPPERVDAEDEHR